MGKRREVERKREERRERKTEIQIEQIFKKRKKKVGNELQPSPNSKGGGKKEKREREKMS